MKNLIPFSVRIDPDLKKKAEKLGLDMADIIRKALVKACNEEKCPTCGQSLKKQSAQSGQT